MTVVDRALKLRIVEVDGLSWLYRWPVETFAGRLACYLALHKLSFEDQREVLRDLELETEQVLA